MATVPTKKSLIQIILTLFFGSCMGAGAANMLASDVANVAECVVRQTTGVDLDVPVTQAQP